MDVVYPRNAGLNPIADENLTISTLAIAIAHAVGTLTVAIQPTDGDTFTIDGKVYTLQTTLTNVDGNIQIGAAVANTQANILAAINLTGTPGTDYAATMTLHPTVYAAEAWIGNDLAITAKAAGTAGNALATTETFTSGSNVFDAATLGTTNAGLDVRDFANIVVITQSLRLRHGGDPVAATTGLLLSAGESWMLGADELADARLVREGGTDSDIWVQYYA
jgi:hypothetical protein